MEAGSKQKCPKEFQERGDKEFRQRSPSKSTISRSFCARQGYVHRVRALACSTKSKAQNRRRRYRSLNRQSKAACAVMRRESTRTSSFRGTTVPREKPVIAGESNISRDCKTSPSDRLLSRLNDCTRIARIITSSDKDLARRVKTKILESMESR